MSAVLDAVRMVKSHTPDNIAQEIRLVYNKWNILDKIQSIVTDNAANMTAPIRQRNVRHTPCFAHTLNLVVQDSINNTEDVQKIKEEIDYCKSFFFFSITTCGCKSSTRSLH